MILNNKGSLAHGHFFLLVIDRAVLVAEAELVAVPFEENIHTKIISDHRVFKPVKLGVLNTKVRLYARIAIFTLT